MSYHSFWSEPKWVTPNRIHYIFNQSQYFEKVLSGKLKHRILGHDNHLSRRQRQKISEPRCTRSQIVLYSTPEGEPVALAHQYRRPNGDFGGCGKPDPKRLFIFGKIIAVRESL